MSLAALLVGLGLVVLWGVYVTRPFRRPSLDEQIEVWVAEVDVQARAVPQEEAPTVSACPACGRPLREDYSFCPGCGTPLREEAS
ncbi:MAG: zinc-ribbon domain-containing protein [Anaerolineales bacterium]